nr:Chain C, ALA-VAL-SER-ARG-ALA [Homo sapiens]
KKVAVSRAA